VNCASCMQEECLNSISENDMAYKQSILGYDPQQQDFSFYHFRCQCKNIIH
jgi:hypothetical protein